MSLCAVIVSYYPDAKIIENVLALLDQVDEAIIVDNGSGKATKELLERLSGYPKVSVIYNEENLGIAAALNIGVRRAKAAGHQWVATFDQDSKVTPGMILAMLRVYDNYPEKEKVVGLSPRYQNPSTGQISTSKLKNSSCSALPYAEVLVVITSGNLLKLNVFDRIGYFNESLFIDHVDSEFCLRCAAQGYKIFEVDSAILLHGIGIPTQHRILWKVKLATNHSSLRRYYMARNGIYLYKKFAFTYPVWVAHNVYNLLKIIIMVLFETNRKQKLVAILRGVSHGLSGRMGKYNASNEASAYLPNKPRD